jgi:hypothetical protein
MKRFAMPETKRPARDIVAGFPAFVAVDADGLYLQTRFVIVEPGAAGYSPLPGIASLAAADAIARQWGAERDATDAEREAAQIGSMFGWNVPGADPLNYGGAA